MPRYISQHNNTAEGQFGAFLDLNQNTVMTTSKLNSLLGLIERLPKHVFY